MEITAAVSRPGTPAPVLEQAELEAPRAGEMRIRIVAVGICHTDIHAHEGRLSPLPITLGHEGAGVVEELGAGVQGFAVGDHVLLSGSSCGQCPSCLNNKPSYCDMAMPLTFGGKRMDGSTALCCGGESLHSHFFGQSSFATHAIVPQRTAVKVDKDLPLDKLAPLGCGIITGAGSVIEALKLGYGESIAIFGTGAVGLSAVMAARLMGAQRIAAVDVKPDRLEMAREMGATDTFLADEEGLADKIRAVTGRGVEYSLNTTTVGAVQTLALDCLAMNGTAGFVSAPRGEWAPAMFPMLAGGKQLRGILGGDAAPRLFLPKLIDYWRQGRFPFDRLIRTYRFDQIGDAFADLEAGNVFKPVLIMPGQTEGDAA
ncbi:alcohol dehydrogenase catalytic domain-containing protein [Altererythrobacter endophyticus]|uniref:Alcohol dehydrogenase catalytic domain-containing protein n=2 Tax=Altericroceibacterium endophyticum TaxID=1808508 RepID=A0A6I4T3C4_9SPHN|nr:alcohol dehydrogenase catalytic domain-containing protein [Altericroceibacterium endophyticum]